MSRRASRVTKTTTAWRSRTRPGCPDPDRCPRRPDAEPPTMPSAGERSCQAALTCRGQECRLGASPVPAGGGVKVRQSGAVAVLADRVLVGHRLLLRPVSGARHHPAGAASGPDHDQPEAAPPGLRRGRAGRAEPLDQGVRRPAADRGARPGRRLRAGDGRAPVAGRHRGRAGQASRPSSGTPPTRRCCATPCWRTSTGRSSTRWKRRRPTSSCWRSSAPPTRSWPAGSAAAGRR